MKRKTDFPISRRHFFKLSSLSGAALLLSAYCEPVDAVSNGIQTIRHSESAVLDPRHMANCEEIFFDSGQIAIPHDHLVLSDGSFFKVNHLGDGSLQGLYSRDSGQTWEQDHLRYADGRRVKINSERGFAWKCGNGKFLYAYSDRQGTLVWLLGGEEVDGVNGKIIRWSQPELLLYTPGANININEFDLIEMQGRLLIRTGQASSGQMYAVPPQILNALWGQFERASVSRMGLSMEHRMPLAQSLPAPELPKFWDNNLHSTHQGAGFTLELWMYVHAFNGLVTVLDGRDEAGKGLFLQVNADRHSLGLGFSDGFNNTICESDIGSLNSDDWLHTAVLVDGGSGMINWVVDGVFNNGWRQFSSELREINAAASWRVNPAFDGEIAVLRVYDRALLISEVISNRRAQGVGMGRTGFEIQV